MSMTGIERLVDRGKQTDLVQLEEGNGPQGNFARDKRCAGFMGYLI